MSNQLSPDGAISAEGSTDLARTVRARVILLSNVRLYRESLYRSLAHRPGFEVLAAHDFSQRALTCVVGLRPDVIILDVGGHDALGLAKTLGLSLPKAKIVAFAVSENDHLVVACAGAGIAGYVPPHGSEEDLVAAIEQALRGELYCSPRIAGVLARRVAALAEPGARPSELAPLTPRERQILGLVGEGMSNKEIAHALRIGTSTVKNHVHNILDKLHVHRRGQAAIQVRALPVTVPAGIVERHR